MSSNNAAGSPPTRKERRERAREERRAKETAQLRKAANSRRLKFVGGVTAALLAVAAAAVLGLRGEGAPARQASGQALQLKLTPLASPGALRPPGAAGPPGPEEVPIPEAPPAATTATRAAGQPVDGIECSSSEQTLFHIHAHLTIFVNGAARRVPDGIGIPNARAENTPAGPLVGSGSCFYWLHTHAADGIIHIESPIDRIYTLGNFFDIWGQPLSSAEVALAPGPVTALYNGQRYDGDPRDIPLTAQAQIQLEVGRPLVAPEVIEFPSGL